MQLSSAKFTVTGDWSAVFDDMYERGFTDGLPVIPPTAEAVARMLEAAGMQPSPEADRTTLIRRLSADLLGLPPTPAEGDALDRKSTRLNSSH